MCNKLYTLTAFEFSHTMIRAGIENYIGATCGPKDNFIWASTSLLLSQKLLRFAKFDFFCIHNLDSY